jgi:hypothetical protein
MMTADYRSFEPSNGFLIGQRRHHFIRNSRPLRQGLLFWNRHADEEGGSVCLRRVAGADNGDAESVSEEQR